MTKSIADLVKECQFWLRLATFLHGPLKSFLLHILHNLSNYSFYNGLPQNPQKLYQELSTNLSTKKIDNLKKNKKGRGILQQNQIDKLLPINIKATDSSQFDVTLLCIMIRNFTTLPHPANGWNEKNPPANDISVAAFVIRAREWRNFIHHTDPDKITRTIFNQKWTEGEQIINHLGFTCNTQQLKSISLDPTHDIVVKSMYLYFERKQEALSKQQTVLDSQQTLLSNQQASTAQDVAELRTLTVQQISDLTQQLALQIEKHNSNTEEFKTVARLLEETTNAQQSLKKNYRAEKSQPNSGSCCLEEVLQHISKKITKEEANTLLDKLSVETTEVELVKSLQNVPWSRIKRELELMGKHEIVKLIQDKTLITKDIKCASVKLRKLYLGELINCIVDKPLSQFNEDTSYLRREEVYVDLIVLPSSTVDKELSNSDRAFLLEQQKRPKSTTQKDIQQICTPEDELFFIRGVAGIGKSTLLDMFTLKWAKNELSNKFEFVFKFTCRDLNHISNSFTNLEDLFKLKFPDVMEFISFDDLVAISERVLVIVDGIDELKDLYLSENSPSNLNQIVLKLLNSKGDWLTNHKVIACGRPKACEFVRKQLPINSKRKTVEVCGFDDQNVNKYIQNFFGDADGNKEKGVALMKLIEETYELSIMARVPVFLYVICSVFQEDLILSKINTNSELYAFATIILLKNHLKSYEDGIKHNDNLMEFVKDQTVLKVLLSLMKLSVKTYMENKVVFTQENIESLNCPIPLESTGFIVKYNAGKMKKAAYQFRHLILHEYFTALYICLTKDITQFYSNRELMSCRPSILGIRRMVEMKENGLFLELFQQLEALVHQSKTNSTFDEFVGNFLKIPSSMIKDNDTFDVNTYYNDCIEFLTLYKESSGNLIPIPLKTAEIYIDRNYKDIRNIVKLMNDLNIKNIAHLRVDIDPSFFECKLGENVFNKIPEELLEKSSLFNITVYSCSDICIGDDGELYDETDVKEIMDFLRKLTLYNKPINLDWPINGIRYPYVNPFYHDRETMKMIMGKFDLDIGHFEKSTFGTGPIRYKEESDSDSDNSDYECMLYDNGIPTGSSLF